MPHNKPHEVGKLNQRMVLNQNGCTFLPRQILDGKHTVFPNIGMYIPAFKNKNSKELFLH